MQETRIQSLGWEDPLEKEVATHSSILDIYNGIGFSFNEEIATCSNMNELRGHDAECKKPDPKGQILNVSIFLHPEESKSQSQIIEWVPGAGWGREWGSCLLRTLRVWERAKVLELDGGGVCSTG